mgnify:CR=1 FL=1
MNIEFLSRNLLNTSTMLTVDSNTAGASFLYDRRPSRQYTSIGYNAATSTTIRVTFSATQTVDHVVLENVNWKQFRIYANGVTASVLALTTTAGTSSANWTGNSATNLFLVLSSATAMTSMAFQIDDTIAGTEEKKAGQIWINSRLYQFDRNPPRSGFTPDVMAKEVVNEMSDGGSVLYNIRNKHQYNLSIDYRTDRSTLKTIYDNNKTLVLVPFPTSSSWDGQVYEMVWAGGFNFDRPSSDYTPVGYGLTIKLLETPS